MVSRSLRRAPRSETEIVRDHFDAAAVANRTGRERLAARIEERSITVSVAIAEPLALVGTASVTFDDLTLATRTGTHPPALDVDGNALAATTIVVSRAIHAANRRIHSFAVTAARCATRRVRRASGRTAAGGRPSSARVPIAVSRDATRGTASVARSASSCGAVPVSHEVPITRRVAVPPSISVTENVAIAPAVSITAYVPVTIAGDVPVAINRGRSAAFASACSGERKKNERVCTNGGSHDRIQGWTPCSLTDPPDAEPVETDSVEHSV